MSTTALKEAITKPAPAAKKETKTFPLMLEMYKSQIALALPKHMNADRMARIALTSYRMTPLLAKCEPASIFACIIQASQLGLEPGINGEAYLVPFWNTKNECYECQLIPGYRGLIKLARNTAQVESVSTRIVYSNDKFDVVMGTDEKITHIPELFGDRGDPVLVYCIAKFKDGGFHAEYMTWKQIMAIKQRSKSKNKKGEVVGPWITDEEEMGRKTVARRGSKYWPMSIELATAVALDNAAAMGVAQELDVSAVIAGESFVVPESGDQDTDHTDHKKPEQIASASAQEPATAASQGNEQHAPPAAPPEFAKAAFPEDFDLEQPDNAPPFTLIDVKAKIKTIEGKAKKAKTEAQKQEVQDLADETADMLAALKLSQAEHDEIAKTLSGFVA